MGGVHYLCALSEEGPVSAKAAAMSGLQNVMLRARILSNRCQVIFFLLFLGLAYMSIMFYSVAKSQNTQIMAMDKLLQKATRDHKLSQQELDDVRKQIVEEAAKKPRVATRQQIDSLQLLVKSLKAENNKLRQQKGKKKPPANKPKVKSAASPSNAAPAPKPAVKAPASKGSGRPPLHKPELPGGEDTEKMNAVKEAMLHSWTGYKQFAWGQDELQPLSRNGKNWLGQGGTIVDALDTLWIMGLKSEFDDGVKWVSESLRFDTGMDVSFFETTIRILGGLLSAYEFSGNKMLLDKARDIGDRLCKSFQATGSGLPMAQVNLNTGSASAAGWTGGQLILAEVGTVQLEFGALSKHTGDSKYDDMAMHVYDVIAKQNVNPPGMYPLYLDPNSGSFTSSQVSLGALGDSFFEYLIKVWLQRGRKDDRLKNMYDMASTSILDNLYKDHPSTGLKFVAEWNGGGTVNKMDHLACFTGGMFALGASFSTEEQRHISASEGIAEVCYNMYKRMPSGLSPEFVTFDGADLSA